MVKKVLFIANHKGFSKFNGPYMQWFREQGWQVDNASPGIMVDCVDNQYDISIQRSPLSLKNIKAYNQLKKLIDSNKYDIIHVHTPMGAFLGRLAARKARKKGTKIIYTAHGFHFFKGAKLLNWLIYYPIELLQSSMMDALVTINEEDFQFAKNKNLANGNIFKIDGVGVNVNRFHKFTPEERSLGRTQLNLSELDFILLYTSQFVKRKNHKWIVKQLPELISYIPNLKIIFAGGGALEGKVKEQARSLGVEKKILFLGFRSDIDILCGISDIHISSSKQEGQGINNLEAMAAGCPLVISDVRGHRDVCINTRNGFLFDLKKPQEFINSIKKLYSDRNLYEKISKNNIEDIHKFTIEREVGEMARIYKLYF